MGMGLMWERQINAEFGREKIIEKRYLEDQDNKLFSIKKLVLPLPRLRTF
jgi:hypothetical protein